MTGKYTIERCTPGGSYNGIEGVLDSDDDLATARQLYRAAVEDNPGRVVLLCQSGAFSRAEKNEIGSAFGSKPRLEASSMRNRRC